MSVPVEVDSADGARVSGPVEVAWRDGVRFDVRDEGLVCDRHGGGCDHVDHAGEAVRALVEARRVRTALEDLHQARARATAALAGDHEASTAAQSQARRSLGEPESSWSEDPGAFQAAYRAARDRHRRGEAAVCPT